MADRNTTTTNRNQYNHEELEALLEIVLESTVGNLKKLFEELTGEITRSNNKPSLIKRVTAQINHLLENDENPDTMDGDIPEEGNIGGLPGEDAPDEETTSEEEETIDNENAGAISADSKESVRSGETETPTADDDENLETDNSGFEESDDPRDMSSDSEGTTDETTNAKRASKTKKQRERDPRLPPAGTVVSREYKGERHEVTVLEEGFTYNGEHFRSLSKIAKHIAQGTSWNGFLFFKIGLLQAQAEEK